MRRALFLFLLLPAYTFAQFQISGVPVLKYGNILQNAWAGGLNNPVFSQTDFNQDGLMDLFIYDKAAWKGQVFLNTGGNSGTSFVYAPQYDGIFPSGLSDWAVIRDYNHDGIGDIFALIGNGGISAYMGSITNGVISYTLTYTKLRYTYGSHGVDYIWTFSDNMPVIADIDNDGDLDVLAPDLSGGVTLDFYQNMAVERGMSADSLVFALNTACWGHFVENFNDCGVTLAYCKTGAPGPQSQGPAAGRHQGGADYAFHYRPGSPVMSLLIADIYCNTIKFLENRGDTSEAIVTYADSVFPAYDHSVNLAVFPAAYGVDADNDGREDLFVSPFASNAYQPGQSEDIKVVQYYHNLGIDSLNKFHYLGDTMLTSGIADVGSESHPVFFDYNGDGLMDIVMGNYGQFQPSGASRSGLALYQNTGTDTMPRYELVSTDWSHLNAFNKNGLYPAFGDMNGDSKPDMVIGDYTGHVSFFNNTSTTSTASYPAMTQQNWFNLSVGQNAAPFIYDVNGDSLPDLIIGSRNNNILYYRNFGTRTVPKFSQDTVNTFFGGIRVYDYHIGNVPGYATPVIARENNALVIYSGSQRGFVYKYAVNQDSLRQGTFQLLDSNVGDIRPGLRSTVSVADINHDGHNDYVAGNIRGGMTLYSDTRWGTGTLLAISAPEATTGRLQVFPNPAKDKVICHLLNDPGRLTDARLYSILGETVAAPFATDGGQVLTLSVSDVAAGIYVLHISDDQGRIYQNKIAIIK